MKIYTLPANENWIVDRFVSEWNLAHMASVSVKHGEKDRVIEESEFSIAKDAKSSDIIWLIADWRWRSVDPYALTNKKVVATVHHIVPDKFGNAAKKDFKQRDEFVDAYHVPCELTKKQIQPLTDKPIYCFPFWVNNKMWYPQDKSKLRVQYGIDENVFLIGSFQRDTEGHDLKSPKLEKGPDVLCDYIEALHKIDSNIEILLAGWRRQYVMSRLNGANIKYHYAELPSFSRLNDFYNMLDLYLVCSRVEGGPQASLEAAATKTPIISSTVGISPEILHSKCLIDNGANWKNASSQEVLDYNYKSVEKLFIPKGFEAFRNMFQEVMKD